MRKPEHRSPHSPPNQASHEGHGLLDEAQDLFVRLTGEVAQRSRLEQEEARSRGPVARFLLALTVAAGLLAAATMLWGVYRFPDAPIRETAGGYAGKGGNPRTQADFEAFLVWQKAMFVTFPSAFALGFAFAVADGMQRRRRRP